MIKINCTRSGCKDVFHAFLVENANYKGFLEIPVLKAELGKPQKLIPFSKCISSKEYDCYVHFYEDDVTFERIWNNPKKYLPILSKFAGVIAPDFSLYRDMPLVMQYWNIYRSRAIGTWLQHNGIKVIPNIRFGDKRTYYISCTGVYKYGVIAVGSHGNLRDSTDRTIFLEGLDTVVDVLKPRCIVVYGAAPDMYFAKYRKLGIEILQFDSCYATSHKEVV